MSDDYDHGDFEYEGPSKSALKREMTARQALGEALCELSPKELAAIPIEDEALLRAIAEARRITSRSALRRHRQFIGKLMRAIDPQPIQEAMDALYQSRRGAAESFQELESLRDELLRDGDEALPRVLAACPGADRQQLRQFVRQARKDTAAGRDSGARRRLFRYLRDIRGG